MDCDLLTSSVLHSTGRVHARAVSVRSLSLRCIELSIFISGEAKLEFDEGSYQGTRRHSTSLDPPQGTSRDGFQREVGISHHVPLNKKSDILSTFTIWRLVNFLYEFGLVKSHPRTGPRQSRSELYVHPGRLMVSWRGKPAKANETCVSRLHVCPR